MSRIKNALGNIGIVAAVGAGILLYLVYVIAVVGIVVALAILAWRMVAS